MPFATSTANANRIDLHVTFELLPRAITAGTHVFSCPSMGVKQRIWAKKAKTDLVEGLGGACIRCGAGEHLEFDCIVPRGDSHHRLSAADRVSFYRAEHFKHGNLQLLCRICHLKKSRIDARRIDFNARVPSRGNSYSNSLQNLLEHSY
jgi:5-methylcytosine-specific restriction endonuclease McrA